MKLGEGFEVGLGPFGLINVAELSSATVEGERLSGRMVGAAAADSITRNPEGDIGAVDVRFTMKTHDDAIILVTYQGRLDLADQSNGIFATVAPTFRTGDPRYAWINRIQAIAKGVISPEDGTISYNFFEVR